MNGPSNLKFEQPLYSEKVSAPQYSVAPHLIVKDSNPTFIRKEENLLKIDSNNSRLRFMSVERKHEYSKPCAVLEALEAYFSPIGELNVGLRLG